MAARTLYPAHEPVNWSEAKWSLADDNAQNQAKPAVGEDDTVRFSQDSAGGGTLTLNENSAALAELDMAFATDYVGTLAFGTNTIDVDGDCILAGTLTASAGAALEVSGSFYKVAGMTDLPALLDIELNGTGLVETNNVGGGTVTVLTAGTHTQIDKALWDAFTLTLGTYRGKSSSPGHGMDVKGDILYSAGTWINSGAVGQVTGGAGTYNIALNDSTNLIEHVVLGGPVAGTGVTSNMTNNVRADEITIGPGIAGSAVTQTGARQLMFYASGNDKWHQTAASGTVACDYIYIYLYASVTIGYLDASSTTHATYGLRVAGMASANDTLTMTDAWDVGSKELAVWHGTAGRFITLDCNSKRLACGLITPGAAGADKSGKIIFGSFVHMASLADADALNLANAVDFMSAYIELSGTFDGDNITCKNSGGGPSPSRIIGGTVNNVDLTGETAITHFWPVAAAGNTNVTPLSPSLKQLFPGDVYVT